MAYRNRVLFVTGVGDTLFSPTSAKKTDYGFDLAERIKTLITNTGTKVFSAYVNSVQNNDRNNVVNLFEKTSLPVIQFKSHVPDQFNVYNSFEIKELDGGARVINATDFDFILPPKNYEIHICGADFYGSLEKLVQDLLVLGYTVRVYNDLIKRHKSVDEALKAITNKNFRYTSHKSVRL